MSVVINELLTEAQAAQKLCCCIRTLRGFVDDGALKYVSVGRGRIRERRAASHLLRRNLMALYARQPRVWRFWRPSIALQPQIVIMCRSQSDVRRLVDIYFNSWQCRFSTARASQAGY